MNEYTVTFDAEITIVGTGEDSEALPIDWRNTEKNLAEAINADDVHIINGKVFISKEDHNG